MSDPTIETREELFLSAAAGESVTLPDPETSEEVYLAKAAGEDVTLPSTTDNRIDVFLAALAEGGGSSVTVEPLSVTENGTYTALEGTAYSPVTVAVPSPEWVSFSNVKIGDLMTTFGYSTYSDMVADIVNGKLVVQAFYLAGGVKQRPCMGSQPYRANFTSKNMAMISGYTVDDFSGNSDYTGAYIRFDSDGFVEGYRIVRSSGTDSSTTFTTDTVLEGRYIKL